MAVVLGRLIVIMLYVSVYTKRYVRQQPYHSENKEADISVVFLKEEQLQGRLLYVNNAVRVIYVMLVHCVVQTVSLTELLAHFTIYGIIDAQIRQKY
jgi:hypothetical protein